VQGDAIVYLDFLRQGELVKEDFRQQIEDAKKDKDSNFISTVAVTSDMLHVLGLDQAFQAAASVWEKVTFSVGLGSVTVSIQTKITSHLRVTLSVVVS